MNDKLLLRMTKGYAPALNPKVVGSTPTRPTDFFSLKQLWETQGVIRYKFLPLTFARGLASIIQYCDKVTCGAHNNEQVPDEMEVGQSIGGKKHDSSRVGESATQ